MKRTFSVLVRREWRGCRSRSFSSSGESSTVAFDRNIKKIQRNNAARAHQLWDRGDPDLVEYDYFRQEIANRLVDRLEDIKRDGFPLALDLGEPC